MCANVGVDFAGSDRNGRPSVHRVRRSSHCRLDRKPIACYVVVAAATDAEQFRVKSTGFVTGSNDGFVGPNAEEVTSEQGHAMRDRKRTGERTQEEMSRRPGRLV